MDDHLGYQKSERSDSDDYRNGYKSKRVNSCYGSMDIDVPQDKEYDLKKAILKNMKKFLLEFGRNFIFIDEEYHFQVGNNNDYYVFC